MKYIIYTMICCMVLSCTDLDETIYHDVTAENYYTNSEEVIAAMMRPWGHFCGIMTYFKASWRLQEFPADAVSFPQKGPHGYDGGDWIRYHRHQWTTNENHINDAWNNLYSGVGYANNLISDFSTLDFAALNVPFSKDQAIAELRLYRAYCYWYLLDFFGGVPVVESILTTSPETVSRTEVFSFVEKEILESLPSLTDNLAQGYGRATKYGAYALLAYLYLNAEVYTGTAQWDKCIEACDAVLSSGKFDYDTEWNTPFKMNNDVLSKENIWVIIMDDIYATDVNWYQRWFHYAQQDQFGLGYGMWNSTVVTPSFWTTFDDRDKRGYLGHAFGPQYKVTKVNDDLSLVVDKTKPILGTEEYKGYPLIIANDEVRFSVASSGSGIKVTLVNAPEFTATDLAEVIVYLETNSILVSNLKEQIAANGGQPITLYLSKKYETMTTGAENIGARSMKYQINYGSSIAGIKNDWVIFRLSGIAFTKAEAMMRKNGNTATQDVCDLINPISERGWDAGTFVPYTPSTLTMDEFLAEHGREFAYEGRRRQDLIRFNKFVTATWWDHTPSNDPIDHVFPIPDRRLANNPNLKPNDANKKRN